MRVVCETRTKRSPRSAARAPGRGWAAAGLAWQEDRTGSYNSMVSVQFLARQAEERADTIFTRWRVGLVWGRESQDRGDTFRLRQAEQGVADPGDARHQAGRLHAQRIGAEPAVSLDAVQDSGRQAVHVGPPGR